MRDIKIANLIDTQYREYSRYVIEFRAIPSVIDGLKPVQRRVLWQARKYANSSWMKVSKLAGQTVSIHPHGPNAIENAISNMAQGFAGSNNIPWFDGKGAMGSRISGPGKGIGAARYVSVRLSESFDEIMNIDSDLIKMKDNYDGTEQEPTTFLPLVPTVLLNPLQGIAVGYACNILPRKLSDVIRCQKNYLEGKGFREPKIYYEGFEGEIEKIDDNAWQTRGVFERKGKKKIIITELPIGYNREDYVKILDNLEEKEIITSYTDDCTDGFNFSVNLKHGIEDDDAIYTQFKLTNTLYENITVIGIDGKVSNLSVSDIIQTFTDYRFEFYHERYKKNLNEKQAIHSFKQDLMTVIKEGLFKKFVELSTTEIKQLLLDNGIGQHNISKIMQVPIVKFGKDEVAKLESELKELNKNIDLLIKLCKSEKLRKDEYLKELTKLR